MGASKAWAAIGGWLKAHGGDLVGLAGAVATGNIPAGVAAVASMVTEATGETDPAAILAKLKADPQTLVKLEEIAQRNEADIRAHHRELLRLELEDGQAAHQQQQETIRSGDNAEDPYVRKTRPLIARQSWYATVLYVIGFDALKAAGAFQDGAGLDLAMVLISPAAAYMGFRTFDKWREWRAERRAAK